MLIIPPLGFINIFHDRQQLVYGILTIAAGVIGAKEIGSRIQVLDKQIESTEVGRNEARTRAQESESKLYSIISEKSQ